MKSTVHMRVREKMHLMILALTGVIIATAVPTTRAEESWRTEERNKNATLKYLRPALQSAGKAGRLYYFETFEGKKSRSLIFPRLRTQPPSPATKGLAAVREIFNDGKITVTEKKPGIIHVNIGGEPTSILQTKIPLVALAPRERFTAELAVIAVTSSKEVQAAMAKLGLKEPLIVTSISVQQPMPGLPHLPATLKDLTMDEALDVIAQTFGGIVIYGESTSGSGSGFIRVQFE